MGDKKCELCNSDLHVVSVSGSFVTTECHTCFATYDHEDAFYNPLTDNSFKIHEKALQTYEDFANSPLVTSPLS